MAALTAVAVMTGCPPIQCASAPKADTKAAPQPTRFAVEAVGFGWGLGFDADTGWQAASDRPRTGWPHDRGGLASPSRPLPFQRRFIDRSSSGIRSVRPSAMCWRIARISRYVASPA